MDVQQSTPRPAVPILFRALLDHAKKCPLCFTYLYRPPNDNEAKPCENGKRCLVSLTLQPTPLTLTGVLSKIEHLAEANNPTCPKCGRVIREGELTDSQGNYHLDCSLPPVELYSRWRRAEDPAQVSGIAYRGAE
jgi:hypothetical protein